MQKSLFLAKSLRKLEILQKGWLIPFNFNLNRKIRDETFKIPILKNIGWNNIFENEPWMTEILEVLVNEHQGSFIDVGVNIGQTLLKLRSLNQSTEYFGFEVNPSCVVYLKELIKVNKLKNTSLFPFGLSDKSGIAELQFFHNSEEDATASIISNYRPDDLVLKNEFVITFRLDDIKEVSRNVVGIIKVVVEGAELEFISFRCKKYTNCQQTSCYN
jgi:FkbM family methyltransferase